MSMILPTNQNATDDEREKLKKKKQQQMNWQISFIYESWK